MFKIAEPVCKCSLCGSELTTEDSLYYSEGELLGCTECIKEYYIDHYEDWVKTLNSRRIASE